jgi:hypothetical protein
MIFATERKKGALRDYLAAPMVAGDRNVLKIPLIPFSFEIIRPVAA